MGCGRKGYDGAMTAGGCSGQVVVRDHFVVRIPDRYADEDLAAVIDIETLRG